MNEEVKEILKKIESLKEDMNELLDMEEDYNSHRGIYDIEELNGCYEREGYIDDAFQKIFDNLPPIKVTVNITNWLPTEATVFDPNYDMEDLKNDIREACKDWSNVSDEIELPDFLQDNN